MGWDFRIRRLGSLPRPQRRFKAKAGMIAVLLAIGVGSTSAVSAAPDFLAGLWGASVPARADGPAKSAASGGLKADLPGDFEFPLCTSATPTGVAGEGRIRQASVVNRPLALLSKPATAPEPEGGPPAVDGVRTYYVGIDEVEWDYAPRGINGLTGMPFTPAQQPYVYNAPDRIGAKNMKVLYREYTDATFKTLKTGSGAWAHLGAVGPVLRGVVGETIRVVARNATSRP